VNALLAAGCVVWPLGVAAAFAGRRSRAAARLLAPWAALPALFVPFAGTGEARFDSLMLGGRLGLDPIAAVLLPALAVLWLAAGLFAQGYLEPGARRDRFFTWFLGALAGNLLLLLALDAVVFYLGFAVMSFAAYGLVVHEGDARARHAGRYYIVLVVVGEICIVSALMLLASRAPIDFASLRASFAGDVVGRNDMIMGLLLLGFGIKAGVLGLHFWLPLAHPVAPAPASAVLSGAMIKAGLVAWMRLLPLGELAMPRWGGALAVVGIATAYYGVAAGLAQREAKTVLAYSSVSQMGAMTLAVGLGLAFPAHWPVLFAVLLVYMVHHSLVKGSLFLGAGLAQHALRPTAQRLLAILLVLGALAMAGAPLTGGLVAKLALKQAATSIGGSWGAWLPVLITLSSVLTALLMARFLWVVWPAVSARAAPLGVLPGAPWIALFIACWTAPWLVAAPALRGYAFGPAAAWTAAWPLLLALGLAYGALRLHRAGRLPGLPRVPPGDLGIPLERAVLRCGAWLGRFANEGLPHALEGLRALPERASRSGSAWSGRLNAFDLKLRGWFTTSVLLLLLGTVFAWLMA
jgi:formate hydrogenlyase subunit 3/multisubunit Na+/H+ antiporter MnhD subunit